MLQFRLFDTPVRVQPWFLLIAVWIGWMQVEGRPSWEVELLVWVLVMFVGVLAHEYGHAFVGRAFGLSPRIELHGMGGLTSWEAGRRLTPGRSIAVSFAGPAVGIVIGIVALVVSAVLGPADGSLAEFALLSIIWVNLGWGILNLAPMMPLDGGNIMASFFELFAAGRGRIFARWLSLLVCAGLLVLALVARELFAVLIVAYLGYINWRGLSVERKIGEDLPLAAELRDVHVELERGNLEAARSRATELRERSRTPLMRGELTQLIAWSHLLGGDARAAGLALEAMPPGRDPEPALLGSIRLQSGDSAGAIEPLRAALGSGGKLVEQQLAEALVREQRFDEAVEAFGTAAARQVAPETLERLEEAAYRAQAFGAAAGIGELLFDREGRGIRAFNVACSLVRKGDEQGALSWLARARDAGLPEPTLLDDDEDLAPLRGRPEWPSLRASFDT